MRRTSLVATIGMLAVAVTSFAAPAKPSPLWAAGQVERVDAGGKSLVIKQGTSEITFTLAPDARLTDGHKPVTTADLAMDVGRQVKVRYLSSAGSRIADRVEVAVPAATPAKPMAKASAKHQR